MRTTTTIRYKLLLVVLLSAGTGACDKLLEVPPPPNEIGIDRAFNDSASAVAAIAGIYNGMVSHGFFEWSGLSYCTARSADDARSHMAYDYFGLDSLLYADNDIEDMWEQGFSSLLMINTCIKALQAPTRLIPSLHQQLLGEALFSRAFVNFYLVNIWGDAIPLIISPDVQVNQAARSVPRQQVYDQIMADLLQAKGLLTNTYPGKGRVRPNLMAANALLARVYLYQGRYNDALVQATTVISSNLYSPLPAPDAAFLQSSREAIWQLMPPTGGEATGAVGDTRLYKSSFASLNPSLLAAFEPGDLRRQSWVENDVVTGNTFTTANKYKDKGVMGSTTSTEYYIVLRLAEQYLIRAEASTRLGQTASALADLNVVRARAGLVALPVTLTQPECLLAVEHERQTELFTEWGHRWFDLRRWPGITNPSLTRADEVLGAIKRDWQSTDQWYPVPRRELQMNSFLVQNPGYPTR